MVDREVLGLDDEGRENKGRASSKGAGGIKRKDKNMKKMGRIKWRE